MPEVEGRESFTMFQRMRNSRPSRVLATVVLVGTVVVTAQNVGAVDDDGYFELGPQGSALTNIADDAPAAPDWAGLFDATGDVVDGDDDGVPAPVDPDDGDDTVGNDDFEGTVFVIDERVNQGESDDTTFAGGAASNKNNDAIADWNWYTGNVPPKDDLSNVYAYAARAPGVDNNGDGLDDLLVYVGIERIAPEGDSHLDIELNQGGIGLDKDPPCGNDRSAGTTDGKPCEFVGAKVGDGSGTGPDDALIVMDFENGGALGFVEFRRWTGSSYELVEDLTTEGCNAAFNGIVADSMCAFNNGGAINGGPWPNYDRHGNELTNLDTNAFTEMGFNLSDLLGTDPCINTIQAKSRSSQSFNSELMDFALHGFDICNPATDVTITAAEDANGDPVNPNAVVLGSTVTFTVTETNTGDVALSPPVAGNRSSLLASEDCTFTYVSGDGGTAFKLDVGETWTFECDVTMSSEGAFTLEVIGHGIDHLGRDVTWYVTPSTTDTDCTGKDGESINTDSDPEPDILCDLDEQDSMTLTVINPSTDIDLAVKSGATDIDPTSAVQLATHVGQKVTFSIAEKNDANTDLTIPGATGVRTDMLQVSVEFDPTAAGSNTTSACSNLTYKADALINADGTYVVAGLGDPDVNGDGFTDGNGDTVLDSLEAWLFECDFTFTAGGTATVNVIGHGLDPLGRDVTWYVTPSTSDTDCVGHTGGSINIDSDPADDVLCDADEITTLSLTVLEPGTVLLKTAGVTINYAYEETNDGNTALSKPTAGWVTDNSCSPVTETLGSTSDGLPSDATHNIGDANNNGKLDPGETFKLTCTTTLAGPTGSATSSSLTNTATADGIDALGAHVTTNSDCAGKADGTIVSVTVGSTTTTYWCDDDEVDKVKVTIEYNPTS